MTTSTTLTSIPVVTIKDDSIVTTSRDVADYFGKQHKHILDLIDGLLAEPDAAAIEPNFRPTVMATKVGFGIRRDRAYDLTRDGFTELVMGFTGEKARKFKRAYIAQFNAMEAALKAPAPTLPTNFAEALRLAADELEKLELAEAKVATLTIEKQKVEQERTPWFP